MFDFVRTHQRWLQFILLLLILPAFVLTGVASFNGGTRDADVLAKVGSRQITQQEFAARYQDMVQQARAQSGGQFDAAEFQKPEMQAAYLTQMVNEATIDELVATGGMVATDNEVAIALAKMKGMPKDGQGNIDVAAYKAILLQQGLTEAAHQQGVRTDLVKGQLLPAYSALNLPMSEEFMKRFFAQSRTVEIKPIDLTPYMTKANISAAQIQTYYDQNKAQFNTPDLFDVEYSLVPVTGSNAASVTDEDIKSVFGKDATAAQIETVRKDATQMKVVIDKVVLKKRAAQIDAQVAKAPQNLAELAKVFNTSVQRASKISRDIDANTPAVLQEPKVREALLNTTQAESKNIAPVMALDSGELFVARVSAYQPAGVRSFDEVKAQIEQQLRREAAITAATEEAQKSLSALNANTSIGNAQTASWLVEASIPQAIAVKAMTMPANALPSLALVSDKDSVSLIRVVKEQALPAEQTDLLLQWAKSNWAGAGDSLAYNSYMNALRERVGVKMYPERIKHTVQ